MYYNCKNIHEHDTWAEGYGAKILPICGLHDPHPYQMQDIYSLLPKS